MNRLSSTPPAHVSGAAHSVLEGSRIETMTREFHRPIPAPEPNPEPNPGPDAALANGHDKHPNITPTDWDELFRAIQDRLENCVSDALALAPDLPLRERHKVTQTAVRECVEAMKQLQTALTRERREGQERKDEQARDRNPSMTRQQRQNEPLQTPQQQLLQQRQQH